MPHGAIGRQADRGDEAWRLRGGPCCRAGAYRGAGRRDGSLRCGRRRGRRAPRGLLLDAASAHGLRFAALAATTSERLAAVLGVGTIIGNPLDSGFTGLTNREGYVKCVEAMLDDPGIDLVLLQ